MIPLITTPGIYPDISDADYRNDNLCEGPTLNASIAKVLITESPRHAWLKHPRLGGAVNAGVDDDPVDEQAQKESKAKDLGTLIHRLLIGKGGEIEVCDYDNWRTNEAKNMRKMARAAGDIPVLPKELARGEEIAKETRKQVDDLGYDRVFRDGLKEIVIVFDYNGVRCRAKLDQLIIDESSMTAEIWDYKSMGRSASPEACGNQIRSMQYDLAMDFYKKAVASVRPELNGRIKCRWIFGEVNAPYAVTPVEINGEWSTIGANKSGRAIEGWKRCLAANNWPFYTDKLVTLEPKPYQLIAEFGAEQIG